MRLPAKYGVGLLMLLLAALVAQAAEPDYCELARHAGIIFHGEVVAVERLAPVAPGEVAVLRVTFRVRAAARGATAGQLLTIFQWDAASAGENYRLGESLVLFLYPPSGELGLTSTVAGQQGRIPAEYAEAALGATRAAQPSADVEAGDADTEPDAPLSRHRFGRGHVPGGRGRTLLQQRARMERD